MLFILVGVLYGLLQSNFEKKPVRQKKSTALEIFKRAEKRWEKEIDRVGSLERFQRTKPGLAFLFNLLSFLVIGSFCIGLILDFFLLFRPAWWRNTRGRGPPRSNQWPLSLLFRVMVLWLTSGVFLSILLSGVKMLILPRLSNNFYVIFHTSVMDVLAVAFIVYVIRERGGSWRDLGFWIAPKDLCKEIGVGIVGYMAILPVFFIILAFLLLVAQLMAYEPQAHPLVEIFLEEEKRSPILIFYSIVLATVLGPVIEEIFFRGFCYQIIKQKWGTAWAMPVTSAFFAIIHQNQFAFWPVFILGMGLAVLYEKRRNLISCISMHIIHNCFFITYFFLTKQAIAS